MSCINKNLLGYQELKNYFGESLANSLIRNNDMKVPNVEEASKMIKADKVLQFKHALNYLRTTTSSSANDLLAKMPRIIQKKGDILYILKGSKLNEVPKTGAKINVEDANIAFLNKVNETFGPIFKIQKEYGLSEAEIKDAGEFVQELLDGDIIPEGLKPMALADPVEFFKFVSDQAQSLNAAGTSKSVFSSTRSVLNSLGQSVVDYAKELFPNRNLITGSIKTINGNEKIFPGKPLPTRFQAGALTGNVEESLKTARDSNTTMGSPYLTNAIYFAQGAIKGPVSIPNSLVLPYSNKALATQLNKLKAEFAEAKGNSINEKSYKQNLKNKIFEISDKIYGEFKEAIKNNLRGLYDSWDPALIDRSRHWYDGANRIAQSFASTYGLSLEATSGVIAAMSPQNEWFNNISAASRVLDIMTHEVDRPIDETMFEAARERSKGEPFEIILDALKSQYKGRTLNELLGEIDADKVNELDTKVKQDIVANLLRVVDGAVHSSNVDVVSPEGVVRGIKGTAENPARFAWGNSGEIYKAISIYQDPSLENISEKMGKGNKVRNFYNNIANPDSDHGEVTIDTHALGASLLNVVSSEDAQSVSLFRNDVNGNSPIYAALKEAYQELAKEKGILPRELQSVTWEGVRLLIHESDKTQENRDFINNIWKQVQSKKLNQNEAIKQIIGHFQYNRPEWVGTAKPTGNTESVSGIENPLQSGERRNSNIRGQQTQPGQSAAGVVENNVGLTFNEKNAGKTLFSENNPETAVIAEQYATDNGMDYIPGEKITKLNENTSKRIADAYDTMKSDPNDPEVKAAYKAMAKETVDQFDAITKNGYKVEIYEGQGEPYANSPEMIQDVRNNKHLYIFGTENGFGQEQYPSYSGIYADFKGGTKIRVNDEIERLKQLVEGTTDLQDDSQEIDAEIDALEDLKAIKSKETSDNPLLQDSGRKDINGKSLVINDVFRFVHDFFGHTERGNSFGPIGEENAWDVHARIYTPLARRAMTTETRGQNSWVNFGAHLRDENGNIKNILLKDRPFADQKLGLLPEEFSEIPTERQNAKVSEGTSRVTVDESKLADLAEENKKANTDVPFEDNIPDAKYQKESHNEGYWNEEQKKRYSLTNLINMLSKKFNIQFEYDNTMDVAAKFSKGKIYLNLDKIGLDTPFHEIAHPFIDLLKSDNPELYNKLIEELKNTPEGQAEIERIAKEYAELSPQEQLDEALVSLIGKNASESFLNNEEKSSKKNLLQRFWDWVKEKLFGMSIDAANFKPSMSISEIANLIANPMFSIDLSRTQDLENTEDRYQKKSSQQMHRDFDGLIDEVLSKLKADVNIHGKTESENKRKFFSKQQVDQLQADRKDINALNSFITSGLFNLKDINDRFDDFIKQYESKGKKSKDDIRKLGLLLNEIEDNITLYSDAGPLLESIFEMFPNEKDNFSDWAYSLKREKRLLNEYQSWGLNLVADWLYPYQQKAIRKAMASNNRQSVVSDEVYNNEAKLAADEGITDKNQILERAVKQEIRNTLLIAKRDASGITGYLAGVLNSRDSIASSVGQAIMDELHNALVYGHHVEKKFKSLLKQYRGSSLFSSNKEEKDFYSKYVRQAKVYTYKGLGEDGKAKYEYETHTAFHEEYEWDTFYNTKREDFDNILKQFNGKIPSKTDLVNYNKYKVAREAWFKNNTILTKDVNGKESYIPSAKYKNTQFATLQLDPLFKEMYNTYKSSNIKLGGQGLKFGIVPQVKNETLDIKPTKFRNALETVRNWIGEQEQVYFVQSIAGGEKPVIPISHVKLLEEKDLSYNFINSVSKFAAASSKYESMKMIEPQVQILKNFIGGNNALNIKKRRTIKRSAAGIKALSRTIHDEMYVESKKLNAQLNSFLNDAVYGQAMKKEVIQAWDSKFNVWKTNDKSNNGGPVITKLHGFENVIQHTDLHDLDYSGFEFNKPRKVGDYTIQMTKKDWNFSIKKTADRLGLFAALQSMFINPISASVNIIRGKTETFVEALGGRYMNLKDFSFGEKEYWKALGSGDFFEDMKGGKPSFLSSMLINYDGIQGELQDASGKKLERGLANKFFRTRRVFFLQNGGEHYIQTQLMVAMMNHQKVNLNSGGSLSLYEARKREYAGTLKLSETDWNPDRDREFRETLAEVNTRLNGNYNKTDKAMIQRTWWGSTLMMFRKHIYNGLANRYRKGYVNYQTGDYTEGYWRQFTHAALREMGDMIRERKITGFNLSEQEKYAAKKFGGDIISLGLFIALFKAFDDDDDDNEVNDGFALIFRRLISESGQYTPLILPGQLANIVQNPSATTNVVSNVFSALKQTWEDPTEEYERSGPGYQEGENKAWKKWQRVIPGWRIVLNTHEPERLLQFYQKNSISFLKPNPGKESQEQKDQEESGK